MQNVRSFGWLFFVCLLPGSLWAQSEFEGLKRAFEGDPNPQGYFWQLGYEDNLWLEYHPRVYRQTRKFFDDCQRQLRSIEAVTLTPEERVHFAQMQYECALNAERSQLYYRWAKTERTPKPGGIYGQPQAKEWFRHFVKSFTGTHLTPEQLLKKALVWVEESRRSWTEDARTLAGTDSPLVLRQE